ncbi:MtrAB system histidine kinase MtrB [Arthrobacter sp. H14]|uniref:MtrAB system histidine kinase MtrB n=1 Tax=Arthrobacter sp. H14 TaxID=1312959 RepID=UPI0004BC410A|nr:MtrAB system histidine kinase MtrB [Arthrobacter sp. H14]
MSHSDTGMSAEPQRLQRFRAALESSKARLSGLRRHTSRQWHRSLQFRTVVATVLLTAMAFVGVGAFLSGQIAQGLYQERLNTALDESRRGSTTAESIFDGAIGSDQATTTEVVLEALVQLQGSFEDSERGVLLTPVINGDPEQLWIGARTAGAAFEATDIPEDLRTEIAESTEDRLYYRPLSVIIDNETVPAIAVGTKVTLPPGNEYELYLIYNISAAQETLDYIHRSLWIAGSVLLLLVGTIAWFVTRAVVGPVGHAADVSEKLAAGELQERMEVRGEDEVARLGASFNHMADNLQQQITQLAQLSHMQQRFVSDVSHELRTPLTTVRMAAEVLYEARRDFDPVNQRSAELLYVQVERFQALLADLLEISRFDAGAAVLESESTDIFSVIRHVIEGAQPLADKSGSDVRIVSSMERCVVDMDPRRIDRILRNLLLNALEHGEGQPIEVLVEADDESVAVAVRDHGIGMSALDASRVFDRFWRADPARARTTGGSGLGLSIATEDARLHGGWLQASGREGKGSCFRLTLPRNRDGVVEHSPIPLPPADFLDGGNNDVSPSSLASIDSVAKETSDEVKT